jgi:phosphoribosylformylglycinamidine (FGAM) synthase PurS component
LVERACQQLLANPVMEDVAITITEGFEGDHV